MEIQDTTLWIHILLQMLAFGIIFPLGMVLGVSLALIVYHHLP